MNFNNYGNFFDQKFFQDFEKDFQNMGFKNTQQKSGYMITKKTTIDQNGNQKTYVEKKFLHTPSLNHNLQPHTIHKRNISAQPKKNTNYEQFSKKMKGINNWQDIVQKPKPNKSHVEPSKIQKHVDQMKQNFHPKAYDFDNLIQEHKLKKFKQNVRDRLKVQEPKNKRVFSRSRDKSKSKISNDDLSKASFEMINQYRSQLKLHIFKWNDDLYIKAQQHTGDQAAKKKLSHDRFAQRLANYGTKNENVAMLSSNSQLPKDQLAQKLLQQWKNSPGHNKNLLARNTNNCAVSVQRKDDPVYGNIYWATFISAQV